MREEEEAWGDAKFVRMTPIAWPSSMITRTREEQQSEQQPFFQFIVHTFIQQIVFAAYHGRRSNERARKKRSR